MKNKNYLRVLLVCFTNFSHTYIPKLMAQVQPLDEKKGEFLDDLKCFFKNGIIEFDSSYRYTDEKIEFIKRISESMRIPGKQSELSIQSKPKSGGYIAEFETIEDLKNHFLIPKENFTSEIPDKFQIENFMAEELFFFSKQLNSVSDEKNTIIPFGGYFRVYDHFEINKYLSWHYDYLPPSLTLGGKYEYFATMIRTFVGNSTLYIQDTEWLPEETRNELEPDYPSIEVKKGHSVFFKSEWLSQSSIEKQGLLHAAPELQMKSDYRIVLVLSWIKKVSEKK